MGINSQVHRNNPTIKLAIGTFAVCIWNFWCIFVEYLKLKVTHYDNDNYNVAYELVSRTGTTIKDKFLSYGMNEK